MLPPIKKRNHIIMIHYVPNPRSDYKKQNRLKYVLVKFITCIFKILGLIAVSYKT